MVFSLLRSPQEEGFLESEQQQAEAAGLNYVNVPVKPIPLRCRPGGLADRVLEQINSMPKPLLAHCKSGLRSGAFSLVYLATKEGMSAEEAMEKGKAHKAVLVWNARRFCRASSWAGNGRTDSRVIATTAFIVSNFFIDNVQINFQRPLTL